MPLIVPRSEPLAGASFPLSSLKAEVAAYMDVTAADLDDSTLKLWALDCLRWLLPLAPEYAVESIATDETSGSGSTGISIPATSLKILSVASGATPVHHRYVSPEKFESIRQAYASGTSSFGSGRGIWSVVGGKVFTFRDTSTVVVRYIATPVWDADNLIVPNGWEGIVALYVAIQAKFADEEVEQAALLAQQLNGQLQKMQGFEDVRVAVGG